MGKSNTRDLRAYIGQAAGASKTDAGPCLSVSLDPSTPLHGTRAGNLVISATVRGNLAIL